MDYGGIDLNKLTRPPQAPENLTGWEAASREATRDISDLCVFRCSTCGEGAKPFKTWEDLNEHLFKESGHQAEHKDRTGEEENNKKAADGEEGEAAAATTESKAAVAGTSSAAAPTASAPSLVKLEGGPRGRLVSHRCGWCERLVPCTEESIYRHVGASHGLPWQTYK